MAMITRGVNIHSLKLIVAGNQCPFLAAKRKKPVRSADSRQLSRVIVVGAAEYRPNVREMQLDFAVQHAVS